MSTKKFLYTTVAIYIVAAVVGIALFRSPGYSRQYIAKYAHDMERRHKIMKNEAYKAYIERPKLHPASAKLLADVSFMKEYESRKEFTNEQRRMFRYTIYFRVLNSAVFIVLMGYALKKPVLDFLDKKVAEIRNELSDAERARIEAAQAKSEADGKMERWQQTTEGIKKETDALIARQLQGIHKELEDTKAQLGKEQEDRRLAEERRAVRIIKEDLVNGAAAALEQRYKTEATQARLTASVDSFVRFMERLP